MCGITSSKEWYYTIVGYDGYLINFFFLNLWQSFYTCSILIAYYFRPFSRAMMLIFSHFQSTINQIQMKKKMCGDHIAIKSMIMIEIKLVSVTNWSIGQLKQKHNYFFFSLFSTQNLNHQTISNDINDSITHCFWLKIFKWRFSFYLLF